MGSVRFGEFYPTAFGALHREGEACNGLSVGTGAVTSSTRIVRTAGDRHLEVLGVVSPICTRPRVLMWLRPLGDHQHLPEMTAHVIDPNFQLKN
jgi:hypothetical protein